MSTVLAAPVCRHCNRSTVTRPRGLCWQCYYTPGVKDLYPSTSKYARRNTSAIPEQFGSSPLPEPTTAKPGTREKLEVIAARAKAGTALFHPQDAQ